MSTISPLKQYTSVNYALIILISLLLLTGCLMGDSKESLIEKANQGDIKSMVELSNVYQFGATKEGLTQYEIWSKEIIENQNSKPAASSKDIIALTNVFYEQQLKFNNGRELYEELLKVANTPLNKEATLTLLKFYSKYDLDRHKIVKLEFAFIKTATRQDLLDLYNAYQETGDYYGYINRNKLKAVMIEMGYMENTITELEQLKEILHSTRHIQETSLLLKNTLKSDDINKIYEIGTFLGSKTSPSQKIKNLINENTETFMKKVLTLEPNEIMEATALFYLSNLYTRHYKNDLTKQKNILINAEKMGETERKKILIALYDIDKAKYDKNIEYFDKRLNTSRTRAYMNIANIYHYGKGKESVDIEQAKIWYKKADTAKAKEALAELNQI